MQLRAGKAAFDDIISSELSPEVMARYQGLSEPYSAFKDLGKAVNAAKSTGGQFSPRQLASAARPGGALEPLAQATMGTLGQPLGSGGLGRAASPWAALFAPIKVGSVLAGGNLLATETAQRALMGDAAAQAAIGDLLEKHPEMTAAIQMVVRNAATTQAGNALE